MLVISAGWEKAHSLTPQGAFAGVTSGRCAVLSIFMGHCQRVKRGPITASYANADADANAPIGPLLLHSSYY